jgi:hypothetical protein
LRRESSERRIGDSASITATKRTLCLIEVSHHDGSPVLLRSADAVIESQCAAERFDMGQSGDCHVAHIAWILANSLRRSHCAVDVSVHRRS